MMKAISRFTCFLTYAISAYLFIVPVGDICAHFGINGGEYIAISILLGVVAMRIEMNGDKDSKVD